MPRKFIKRFLPRHEHVRDHKHLRLIRPLLDDPNILHLNRRSVSGAVGIGLFFAFVPIPFQMLLAAIGSLIARVNLPICVAMVWISNPLTMPPLFYFAYRVGVWLLGAPERKFHFELSWTWLMEGLGAIWQPFLLGCFFVGAISGLISSLIIRVIWRFKVQQSWNQRKQNRLLKNRSKP